MACQKIGLVYGGGQIGLMGVLADAVLAESGQVLGIIPRSLVERELAHQGLTELRIVETMHERKALMADLADGFVAMSGGFGTADELFEILTWAQLGLHSKPIGLFNVGGFFEALLAWIDRCVADGFVSPDHRALVHVANDEESLLHQMRSSTSGSRASASRR
jgi:uncharacterized protein (TIGR00730 family)